MGGGTIAVGFHLLTCSSWGPEQTHQDVGQKSIRWALDRSWPTPRSACSTGWPVSSWGWPYTSRAWSRRRSEPPGFRRLRSVCSSWCSSRWRRPPSTEAGDRQPCYAERGWTTAAAIVLNDQSFHGVRKSPGRTSDESHPHASLPPHSGTNR